MNGEAINNASSALSKIFIGPDTIFAGDVVMLNANIFRDISVLNSDSLADAISDELGESVQPGAHMVMTVRKSIANIYYILRNICGFIMLAGLIYTGIQILLTSNIPTKKTQYLMLLQDWMIGMVLLIFSHIIMIGIFYVSDTLTNALKLSLTGIGGLNATLVTQCLASWDSSEQIICLVMLGYLIYLTVIFAIAYFKRFLWVCVLIAFAPIVSVMYAFGQQTKRIYTDWLREYVTTVFVQPFHLIIYWVLVSIPMNMVNSTGGYAGLGIGNSFEIIYALVAIGFIRPAEAYMRRLFGMNQGIANMASFDSGKQTFDQIKRTVTETVKKVGLAVATVYTGGAAAAASKGISSVAAKEGGKMLAKEGGKQLAGDMAKGEAQSLGNNMLGNDMGINEALPKDTNLDKYNAEGLGQNANTEESKAIVNAENQSSINAANVIITAGNIDIEGLDSAGGFNENKVGEDLSDSTDNKGIKIDEHGSELDNIDNDIEIEKGKGTYKKKNFVSRSIDYMKNANDLVDGKVNLLDLGAQANPDGMIGKLYNKVKDTKAAELYKTLENNGGTTELYKGLNSIRDTFFVTPPPQDWKNTVAEREKKKKERDEKAEYNFVQNEGNREYIIKQEKLMEKYSAKNYPKKTEAERMEMAKKEAETKLSSLAKSYIPLGVTDVEKAWNLKQDQKKYGYSPDEALIQSSKFERFNSNKDNILKINHEYKDLDVNVKSVSEAIPNARDHFNNGINDINTMINVDQLSMLLKEKIGDRITEQTRNSIAMAIAKKGEVKYNGDNKEIKKIFEDINKAFLKTKESK